MLRLWSGLCDDLWLEQLCWTGGSLCRQLCQQRPLLMGAIIPTNRHLGQPRFILFVALRQSCAGRNSIWLVSAMCTLGTLRGPTGPWGMVLAKHSKKRESLHLCGSSVLPEDTWVLETYRAPPGQIHLLASPGFAPA